MVAFHTPISCKSTVFSMRFASLRPPVDSLDWSAGSSHHRLLTSPPLDGTTTATTIARPPAPPRSDSPPMANSIAPCLITFQLIELLELNKRWKVGDQRRLEATSGPMTSSIPMTHLTRFLKKAKSRPEAGRTEIKHGAHRWESKTLML